MSNTTTGLVDCYCGDTLFYVPGITGTQTNGELLKSNCEFCPDKRGNCGRVDSYALAVYGEAF
jgi:hypothetical protein